MSPDNFTTNMLNIDSSRIESLESSVLMDGTVCVRIRLKKDPDTKCPLCNHSVRTHGYRTHVLKHSTLANRPCKIIYEQRRFYCPDCHKCFCEPNPFAAPGESLTYETKINVLKDLKYPNNTYTSVGRRYNLATTQVLRIFDNHVDIPRKTLPEVLSIDEHYMPALDFDSLYICVFMDFNTGVLIDILPDRKKEYISSYLNNIRNETLDPKTGKSELGNVKFVSIDLYDTYKDLASIYFPQAVVCADSFHVLEHLTECFKQVRLKCRRNTEDENLQYLLTKFKYIFDDGQELDNKGKYNKRFRRHMNYRDMMNLLFERFPELKTAYELKQEYIHFNRTANLNNAKEKLFELIQKFADSQIKEYVPFYNLLLNWSEEIINSFNIAHGKRINNSYIESRNKQIEVLIYNANGFQNYKRTRKRILYCINKDDNYKI